MGNMLQDKDMVRLGDLPNSPEWAWLQDSQDIWAALESVGLPLEDAPGYALVKVDDGEITEIWGGNSPMLTALWRRYWPL